MKAGKVTKLLEMTKPTLLKKIGDFSLDTEKTSFGENIFRWKHIFKLNYLKEYGPKLPHSLVISICQNKGGVGKTTSVINLASALSFIGKTLVVDLDSQANLSQAFDVYVEEKDISLSDVLDNPELVSKSIKSISDNLDIIPNHMKFDKWKRAEKNNSDVSFALRKALKDIKNNYNFILIDTPPALDLSLELALYASNYYLIPFQPKPFSLEGIANIIDEIQNISKSDKTGTFEPKMLGIFINIFEKNKLSQQISEFVSTNYDVFNSKISRVTAIEQAQAVKQPIFDYEEQSQASYDYFYLLFEILKKIQG